jgi:hypothetical protein
MPQRSFARIEQSNAPFHRARERSYVELFESAFADPQSIIDLVLDELADTIGVI